MHSEKIFLEIFFVTRSIGDFPVWSLHKELFYWLRTEHVINKSTTSELLEPLQCAETKYWIPSWFDVKTLRICIGVARIFDWGGKPQISCNDVIKNFQNRKFM